MEGAPARRDSHPESKAHDFPPWIFLVVMVLPQLVPCQPAACVAGYEISATLTKWQGCLFAANG